MPRVSPAARRSRVEGLARISRKPTRPGRTTEILELQGARAALRTGVYHHGDSSSGRAVPTLSAVAAVATVASRGAGASRTARAARTSRTAAGPHDQMPSRLPRPARLTVLPVAAVRIRRGAAPLAARSRRTAGT